MKISGIWLSDFSEPEGNRDSSHEAQTKFFTDQDRKGKWLTGVNPGSQCWKASVSVESAGGSTG